MQKNEVLDLIATMPLEENQKLSLIDDINNNVPIASVLEKISTALGVKGKLLDENNPDLAKVYADISQQYNADIQKASDEFDEKMEEIEKEAEDVNKEISKKLDDVRIEELQETLEK